MLDKKQRLALKAQAHHLKPVILLGQHGLTEAVQKEVNIALNSHELIKIKLAGQEKADRQKIADTICKEQSAEFIHMIGSIAIIYRKNEEK